MRRFPPVIQGLIEKSGQNLNRISLSSGISNTYLAKLQRGAINRPGKDKLASVMLALNYTISEINEVLSRYDYQPLHAEDIPAILANNRGRKIGGGSMPQFDHVYFDLLLVVLEQERGDSLLVKDRPSDVFMPHKLYLLREYPFELSDGSTAFRQQLTKEILKERRQIFLAKCERGAKVTTYICKNCFDDFIGSLFGSGDIKNHVLGAQYLANALSLIIKRPEYHTIHFMERCPYFHFIVYGAEGDNPKVSFTGRKLHDYSNESDRRMFEGFTSDLPHTVQLFLAELKRCHEAHDIMLAADYPNAVVDYFQSICTRYQVADLLEQQLEPLLASSEMILH